MLWLKLLVRRTFPRILRIGRTPSLGDRQCDCAERSVDRFVFTCPLCVGKVVESSAFKFLTEAVESVMLGAREGARDETGDLCG